VRGAARGAGASVGVLVMAHGTPRSIEELPAFYTEIRRGRPPSAEQLAELEARYRAIGGTSPLNDVTGAQVAGVARALERRDPGRFTVAGGAKFAPPRIEEAVDELVRRGVERIVGVVLAPHSSRVSVGDYARRAAEALSARPDGEGAVALEMVDHWYDEPELVTLLAQRVGEALGALGAPPGARRHVLFTAHSIPAAVVEAGDDYPDQLQRSARLVAEAADLDRWSVAWQSAGRTGEAWLGPDVNTVIEELARSGTDAVVICPIGFVSDHLEVLYDVDIEARATAARVGIGFGRTASLNDDPRLSEVLADVVRSADRARRDPR